MVPSSDAELHRNASKDKNSDHDPYPAVYAEFPLLCLWCLPAFSLSLFASSGPSAPFPGGGAIERVEW